MMSEMSLQNVMGGSYVEGNYSGVVDAHSGFRYQTLGAYPGRRELVEMEFALARALSAVAGGRVYRDSTDAAHEFSITTCHVIYRGELVTVAGSVNNALGGGNVAHYVYIDPDAGTLEVETSGWPATPHVRIAVITLADGSWNWDNVVDHRHVQTLRVIGEPPGGRHEHEDMTADDAIAAGESRKTFTNAGAAALVTLTLPTPAVGIEYEFMVLSADGLKIQAATGHTIRIAANVSDPGGYIQSAEIGSTIRLRAVSATEWVALGTPSGTWMIDG